ncbi:MAG: hypothetical protein CSA62_03000 [Planctomycetota bacterium]|nr:MAG: hypothetical protein CSA62_03000 [Planctomycetota bacterium]
MIKSPITLALCSALLAAPLALAQGTSRAPLPKSSQADSRAKGNRDSKKARKPEWPRLKFVRKNITKEKMRLLTAKDTDKRASARQSILSYGPATCPVLMDGLNDKQSPQMQRAIGDLLDELTQAAHASLIAKAYKPKNLALSRWVVRRLASFQNKGNTKFFREAAKHQDSQISETAQFALASLGNTEALPFLLRLTREQWDKRNLEIRSVLPALKGKAATKQLATRLALSKDSKEKIACLRLLAGAGTKDAVPSIASMLNSSQHQVRVAAINALRGIIDGQRPYANLTVFNAINEVKKWKSRLGR